MPIREGTKSVVGPEHIYSQLVANGYIRGWAGTYIWLRKTKLIYFIVYTSHNEELVHKRAT
jgi:hypothetical protein